MSGGTKQEARLMAASTETLTNRVIQLQHETYLAWRVGADSFCTPIDVSEATRLTQAVDLAAPRCAHKDALIIQETHAKTSKWFLHHYLIKQESKAQYRRNPVTGMPEHTRRQYADRLFSIAVHTFDPLERWKWTPGCDVVGADPVNHIEGK